MNEEEVLYEALASELGLVVKADPARLRRAKTKLAKSDPAILGLYILGPDRSGQLYVIRADEAREKLNVSRARGDQP